MVGSGKKWKRATEIGHSIEGDGQKEGALIHESLGGKRKKEGGDKKMVLRTSSNSKLSLSLPPE